MIFFFFFFFVVVVGWGGGRGGGTGHLQVFFWGNCFVCVYVAGERYLSKFSVFLWVL